MRLWWIKTFIKNLGLRVLGLILLWNGVVISGLGVVYSTHQCRQLIHELESIRRETGQLQVVWGQYLLEQSTWAAYSRIEQVAIGKLGMKIPNTKDVVMVEKRGSNR